MRLILRDYIASLKEEGELDLLITDLLFAKGIAPLIQTQKGVRQFGVDVAARGKDEDKIAKLFLVTVKKGNITRSVWNSGPQAVRPSLDEIQDVHIQNLPDKLKNLPCKIILATNGVMNQDMEQNWNGYEKRFTKEGELEFEFWDLNYLALELENHLMNEYLFPKPLKVFLQKTLSLIDLNDYDLRHYYQLIEEVLFGTAIKNQKDAIKRLRLLNLCQGMIFKWGVDADNLKNVFTSSERLMVRVADLFRKNEYFNDKKLVKELSAVFYTKLKIGFTYFEKIKPHCYVEHTFSTYAGGNEAEYPLLTFEQIGILATIGLENFFIASQSSSSDDIKKKHYAIGIDCAEALWQLIENNPSSYFVLYDDHVVDITLALILFYRAQGFDAGIAYMNRLITRMLETFKFKKFFPLFRRNYDELIDSLLGQKEVKITSSHLLLILAELSLAFGSIENYDFIRVVIEKHFSDLNLQIWFPGKDTEETYYRKNAMSDSGNVQVNIQLPVNYLDYLKRVEKEFQIFSLEKEFYLGNKLSIIPVISSRHYRNLLFPIYWRSLLVLPLTK